MKSTLQAEDRLSNVEWLRKGYGLPRTRDYLEAYQLPTSDVLKNLSRAISNSDTAGNFVSSTGIGHEMLAGRVDASTFEARFYSPIDLNVVPMTRVDVMGEVTDSPSGGSLIRISVQPNVSGLYIWIAGVTIGVFTFLLGVAAFASHAHWKSFGISLGIALAFVALPSLLLTLAVSGGRRNERRLLELVHQSIESPGFAWPAHK